jgi:hypothetical protein
MPAIYVGEIWNGRTGSADEHGARSYARIFRVITNNQLDGSLVAMGAVGIPRKFSAYVDANLNFDAGCIARKISAAQDQDHPCFWIVTVGYSTSELTPRQQPSKTDPSQQGQENPLLRPPTYKLSFNMVPRPLERDLNRRAVVNSASEKFDPPPMIEDDRPVLTIERNEANLDLDLVIDYHNAINSDHFFGSLLRRRAKLKIAADQQNENGFAYWKFTYTLEFRRESWQQDGLFLDQGFHKATLSGIPKVITDEQGKCLTSPALLDGSGQPAQLGNAGYLVMPDGTPLGKQKLIVPSVPKVKAPSYIQYKVYRERPFRILNLVPPS